VLLSLAVLGTGGWFVYTKVNDAMVSLDLAPDFEGPGKADVVVTIPKGASHTEIGDLLVQAKVVASTKAFLNATRDHPEVVNIQAGTYKLKTELPAEDALEMLLDPETRMRSFVTVPEGLRLSQQLSVISEKTGIPLEDLEKAAKDTKELKLPDYAPNAEGFLFPNTYESPEEVTPEKLLARMVGEYNSVAKDIGVEERAKSLGVTPLELVTIASIVEREVRRPEDRGKVARVIYNRLQQDMELQMDSTVHYAVDDYST